MKLTDNNFNCYQTIKNCQTTKGDRTNDNWISNLIKLH